MRLESVGGNPCRARWACGTGSALPATHSARRTTAYGGDVGPSPSLAALLVLTAVAMSSERRGALSWLATRSIESIDIDEVLAGVDVDALLARVDVDKLLGRVDVDAVLARIDIDAVLARVDVDAIARRIDVDSLVRRVDVDAVVRRMEVDEVVRRVDVEALLDRVDPDRVADRLDVNAIARRIDVQMLADRLDVQRIVDRVDVQGLVDRVDVQGVVDRAGLADIVADSTGAVATSMLDVARRQLVAVDTIVERVVYSLVRRDSSTRPESPQRIDPGAGETGKDGRALVSGHYAGPVSRALAFIADCLIAFWLFTAGAAATTWVLESFGISLAQDAGLLTAVFLLWAFSYWFTGLALTGRTGGKALVGLKVVDRRGSPLTAGQAAVRTLALPLSFVALVGVAAVLVTQRRSSLHDAVSRTCEIYDWGDRPAELPAPLTAWIARRSDTGPDTGAQVRPRG